MTTVTKLSAADYLLRALEKGPADLPTLATRTNSSLAQVNRLLAQLSSRVKQLDSGRYALRGWKAPADVLPAPKAYLVAGVPTVEDGVVTGFQKGAYSSPLAEVSNSTEAEAELPGTSPEPDIGTSATVEVEAAEDERPTYGASPTSKVAKSVARLFDERVALASPTIGGRKPGGPCEQVAEYLRANGPQHYRQVMEATGCSYNNIIDADASGLIRFDLPTKRYHVA